MERQIRHVFIVFFFVFFSFSFPGEGVSPVAVAVNMTPVKIGVVLDLGTLVGKKNWVSISMAVDEFYASHSEFSTRLILEKRDSKSDIVAAASAALDLLKNVNVQAIIGPITSSQTKFVAELGNKAQVPILSFSATSPTLSSSRTPYFVRTTLNDSSQVDAIAAIVKSYGWREVVPIYEDSEFGTGIIPPLVDAFTSINVVVPYRSVIPSNASEDIVTTELYKLKTDRTRVFVVHMMPKLASQLFLKARSMGLMSQGYAWIATDSLTDILDTIEPAVLDSMEGIIGVRPYIRASASVIEFSARWRERFSAENPSVTTPPTDPSAFQLWAYDTTWALALATETARNLTPQFRNLPPGSDTSTDLGRLGVSKNGPKMLAAISGTQFHGLSGNFSLVDGQRQSSTYEIVNVVGKVRRIGFWSPKVGIITKLKSNTSESLGNRTVWPGSSKVVPKGWEIPTMGKKLLIAVPVKDGFNQFVNTTGQMNVTGYCIDVFDAVMSKLGYDGKYEFQPFGVPTSSYDNMVYQVYLQRYDAVVGDVTIVANRSLYVDFTLPYTESGVSMIVSVKKDKKKTIWIFLDPLSTDLWLASLAFFFFTGFVVWVIEHRINSEFRGPPSQQMGTIFYFAFSTLVFAHRESLVSNLSRFLVIIWLFVVLILTSSYTASLTSMLTVQQLQPTVADVSELIKNGDFVGYQDGSFVKGLLKGLNFDEKKLKNYSTPGQYAEALSKGSKNGGVAALFDELPYLRIFLTEYCPDYVMVGPTYKTDGFGFVFPRGSPLVSEVSRAILNVREGDQMKKIEMKWFGDQTTNCPSNADISTSSRLNFRNFGGLFLITGVASSLSLLFFLSTFIYKEWDEVKAFRNISAWCRHYNGKDYKSHTFRYPVDINGDGPSRRNEPEKGVVELTNGLEGLQSPLSVISSIDVGSPEIEMTLPSELGEPPVNAVEEQHSVASIPTPEIVPAEN